jgi:platelet-activating factor acetylhydrolase
MTLHPFTAGATHPSFSDVFLILPEYVNKLTGLRVSAARVLELTVNATYDFLKGDGHNIPKRCRRYDPKPAPGGKLTVREGAHGEVDDDVGEVPKPVKPLGTPGELVWHPF